MTKQLGLNAVDVFSIGCYWLMHLTARGISALTLREFLILKKKNKSTAVQKLSKLSVSHDSFKKNGCGDAATEIF